MAKDLAIVLNNGSVNAAVAAALAAQRYRTVLLYGETAPRAGSRARGAYDQQVAHFKPYREHTLPTPLAWAVAAADAPASPVHDARQPQPSVAPRLVDLLPLLGAAARYAVHYQANAVYLGLRVGPQGDALAQATEYVQIWNELLQQPCAAPELEIVTPLLELELWQVVDLGFQTAVPFERTWSCVEDAGEPCWSCRGCRAREAAFQQAAKVDPLRSKK